MPQEQPMTKRSAAKKLVAGNAEEAAARGRSIQATIDQVEATAPKKSKSDAPMQVGQRQYPSEFPAQHVTKPGLEADLKVRPMFEAPAYIGSEKLKNRAAIITGGDSGIGRAVAVLYAREGADVAIVYLDEHEDAEETKRAVEKEGRRCITISGDVADAKVCVDAVKKTIKAFGKLDILVNNAAFQQHATFDDLSEEQFDRTLKTNLYGYFHMAKAAIPHMKSGSAIVMTGSVTGLLGNKDLLDYSMTKGAIHAFTRSLGTHLIERGIRVNAVAPGPVWTPLNPADKPPEAVAKFGSETPMKRAAQPEEIAPAYVFLAAPTCSSYITGEILPIIGGYLGG
jgi:NAD(P)-dependent dehydrogenase (short-subunit alcohol dehydrogenase family)